MATNFPGSLDTSTQQPSPSSSTEMDDSGYEHDVVHTNHSGAIIALETKLGTTDSNPTANAVLMGTGSGTSEWDTSPTFKGAVTVGVDDTGHDVKFFGATSDSYFLWDESADQLIIRQQSSGTGLDTGLVLQSHQTSDVNLVIGDGIGIDFWIPSDDSPDTFHTATIAASKTSDTDANEGTRLEFQTTENGGSIGTRMVIDDTGKVGIGDTTPLHTLEVHSDDDLTSFTGTGLGVMKLVNNQYDADDFTCLDFGYSGSANPIGRIGLKITSGGSQLHFGTSNNYSNGITNTAMVISQTGNVSIEDGDLTIEDSDSSCDISLSGAGTGYTQASVKLSATGDSRGTGTYGFNAYNDTTWFWGNPYGYEDSFRVCRKASTTSLDVDAASGGSHKLMRVMSDGDMTIEGTLTESSDSRLKTEIVDSPLGLDFVNALKPREYRRVDGVRKHYGFIAQEVAAVLPNASDNAIWTNDEENVAPIGEEENIVSTQGLRYTHLIAPLVKAVQELTTRIEALEG